MKKGIICVLAGVAAGVVLTLLVIMALGMGKGNASETAGQAKASEQLQNTSRAAMQDMSQGAAKDASQAATQNASQSTEQNASQAPQMEPTQQAQQEEELADIYVNADRSNGWESNGKFYSQYDISLTNNGSSTIDGWKVTFAKEGRKVTGNWNCEIEDDGENICISPVEFNKKIEPGAVAGGAGIIVEASDNNEITDFKVRAGNVVSEGRSDDGGKPKETQATPDGTETNKETDRSGEETKDNQNIAKARTVNAVGRLHVEGTQLVNASGEPVQLKGVSTHGLAWYPDYVNSKAFATLKEDWNANVVRLAMYTSEYGGYCNGGDRQKLKKLIDDGVSYATSLGMYVIIDWHILSDNNPQTYRSEAVEFFSEMSAKYADHDNVIYEICNEPHNVNWNNDIKPYANEVISAIRKNDKQAVILVGTNTWSQDVGDVIGNKVDDDNVMYVLHFYAATHRDDLRNKLISAKNAGVPIFVSECSICDASGNGGIDYDSADKWLSLMNENNISFVAWSLSNKNETSALIRSDCSKLDGWSESDLTETGKWFRNAIKN